MFKSKKVYGDEKKSNSSEQSSTRETPYTQILIITGILPEHFYNRVEVPGMSNDAILSF